MSMMPEEEQVQEEELEMGVNPAELFADTEEKNLEIVHKGKKWVFKYKDLSWKEKYACVDEATDMSGEFKFSLTKYYVAALTKMLTKSPIHPLTETTLSKLAGPVGAQLMAIVPPPVDAELLATEKKE